MADPTPTPTQAQIQPGPRLTSLSPGAGCACKLPLAKLEELFATMEGVPAMGPASGDLLIGALEGDDAAVLRLDDERALVLTTDFFTPIVDDPGDWGRIAAANALSDVYAMGGRPLFAVNLAAWPGDGSTSPSSARCCAAARRWQPKPGASWRAATRSTIRCPSTAWPWWAWPTRTG
jgi:selenium donor protein